MAKKINLINHYKNLFYFNFNRFKNNNYQQMREYFVDVFIYEIEEFMQLSAKCVLDVGGANGEFCKVLFEKVKCNPINLELNPKNYFWSKTIIASADKIPFKDNNFELVICRGVLEHIPTEHQQQSVDEIYRVTKPECISYIVIPPWYNPHAGHSLKPFHILPFKYAKFLKHLISKRKISVDSYSEAGLFPITYKKMLNMIKKSGFKLIGTKDTHFRLHFLNKLPIIREIAIPAVAFILKK